MKLLVGIECLPALYFLLTYSGSQLYTPKAIGQQYCLDKTDLTPQPPSLQGYRWLMVGLTPHPNEFIGFTSQAK